MLRLFRPCFAALVAALVVVIGGAQDSKKDKDKDKSKDLVHLKANKGDGIRPQTLVHFPGKGVKGAKGAPVVFVFHGHGGSAKQAANQFGIHEDWSDAVCVYMQGVPTATRSDPKGEFPGWQNEPGEFKDRDLAYFDAVLKELKTEYDVDAKRVGVVGFSNGGNFAFLLWDQRPNVVKALAIFSGSPAIPLNRLNPRPCLIASGANEMAHPNHKGVMEVVRKLNGCDAKGDDWPPDEKGKGKGKDKGNEECDVNDDQKGKNKEDEKGKGKDDPKGKDDAKGKDEPKGKDKDDGNRKGDGKGKDDPKGKEVGKGKDEPKGKNDPNGKDDPKGKDKDDGKGKDGGKGKDDPKGTDDGKEKDKEKGKDDGKGKDKDKNDPVLFRGKGASPVVWYPHRGGHDVPNDGGRLAALFLRQQLGGK